MMHKTLTSKVIQRAKSVFLFCKFGYFSVDNRQNPLWPPTPMTGAVTMLARLSERVREGLRTAEIAAGLRRSPLTIKTQLAAIFAKLSVRGRTRIAALLNR
jgi:hypothetical protein